MNARHHGIGFKAGVCTALLALALPLSLGQAAVAAPAVPVGPMAPAIPELPIVPAEFAGNNLLSDAAPAGADVKRPAPFTAARDRIAAFRGERLAVGASVTFNLFPGLTLKGDVTSSSKVMSMRTWRGKLTNTTGYFYAAQAGDAYVAHVATLKGVYEISKVGDGTYRVIELDQSKNREDAPGTLKVGDAKTVKVTGEADDSAARIDIMVAYTPLALAGEGSQSALFARIALAVAETNGGYAKAGVTTRLRLVHIQPTSYTESGDFQTDLNRVVNPYDGYMDEVPKARNGYGADMVALILENGDYCGLATSIRATSANAYTTVSRGCATGYYTFGHEFGHLQGARHDVYVDNSTTPFSYGHGFTKRTKGWRTIMAYNNACLDYGVNCTRLQYWSNPYKTYNGSYLGNSTAKNYAVLNLTDTAVANFRATVIADNFSSSFTSSTSGWWAVDGPWKLSSYNYYSPGVTESWNTAAHTGVYGDVDYSARVKRTGSATSNSLGLLLRGAPTAFQHWSPSYLFVYTPSGSISIWRENADGTETPLYGWTHSSAVITGSAYNVIRVVAVGSTMRMYMNGVAVAQVTDTTNRVGNVGVGFYRAAGDTDSKIYVDWAKASTAAATSLGVTDVPRADAPQKDATSAGLPAK